MTAQTYTDITIDPSFFKIHYLINGKAPAFLRGQFVVLWLKGFGEFWTNHQRSGTAFVEGIGKALFAKSQRIQKNALSSGNIHSWDLGLLSGAIKTLLQSRHITPDESYITVLEMEELKKIRNKVAHLGSITIAERDFSEAWNTAVAIMKRLGLSEEEISAVDRVSVSSQESAGDVEALRLKEMGNTAYRAQDYAGAIAVYTSASKIEGTSVATLAILYSNRSAAYLGQGGTEDAKDDAKRCVILRPDWPKAYSRLGFVYEREEEPWKALMQYRIALSLDSTWVPALEGVKVACQEIRKLALGQHLNVEGPTFPTQGTSGVGEDERAATALIKAHVEGAALFQNARVRYTTVIPLPTALETIPPSIIGLKSITFKEFDHGQTDKLYKGTALQLKGVNDAVNSGAAVSVVVMDGNGHFGRVMVYNYPSASLPTMQGDLGFGSVFTVIHPYYKLGADGKGMAVRVEDPNSLVKLSHLNDHNLCRYCFKSAGATLLCPNCRRVSYCSEGCCKKDIQERSHGLVCKQAV